MFCINLSPKKSFSERTHPSNENSCWKITVSRRTGLFTKVCRALCSVSYLVKNFCCCCKCSLEEWLLCMARARLNSSGGFTKKSAWNTSALTSDNDSVWTWSWMINHATNCMSVNASTWCPALQQTRSPTTPQTECPTTLQHKNTCMFSNTLSGFWQPNLTIRHHHNRGVRHQHSLDVQQNYSLDVRWQHNLAVNCQTTIQSGCR